MDDFINEGFIPEDDSLFLLIQEASLNDEKGKFNELIMGPIIDKLENSPSVRKRYIEFGTEFIEANAEWLAREYPTIKVSYPRKYVDNLVELFGWSTSELRNILHELLKEEVPKKVSTDFRVIIPTNIIHAVVFIYADMKLHPELRKSARQQLGISVYDVVYNKWFKGRFIDEKIMAYTYGTLDRTFLLVQSENVVNWISGQIDVSYQFWKTKISLSASILNVVYFLGRVLTTFNQSMGVLAKRFHENYEFGNLIGDDTTDSEHVDTDNFTTLKNNLIRAIRTKDHLYVKKNTGLYEGVAVLKKVNVDQLYELSMEVDVDDIDEIITLILYCFITKDGNSIKDIQSTKYWERITKFPTQIDRARDRKPVIAPFVKKYETTPELCKAYIIFIAIFIMKKMNELHN